MSIMVLLSYIKRVFVLLEFHKYNSKCITVCLDPALNAGLVFYIVSLKDISKEKDWLQSWSLQFSPFMNVF